MPTPHLTTQLAADEALALDVILARLAPAEPNQPLRPDVVWMPAGSHEISAHSKQGGVWQGTVICDEAGARSVAASFERIRASGKRVRFDEAHSGDAATAWVKAFRWDPARGIVADVEWTSLGEELVRGRVYTSFSPEFLVSKTTHRVTAIQPGFAAGGLVNEPAFGAAMPALIAARLAGTDSLAKPAPASPAGNQPSAIMKKEQLIQLLAALSVTVPENASEEQVAALAAQHLTPEKIKALQASAKVIQAAAPLQPDAAVQAKLAELDTLKAADATRRQADAKKAVDTAVARGAIPAKDEAVQARWRGLIEADPTHAQLLAALPDNPALQRVTQPGEPIQARDNLVPCLQSLQACAAGDLEKRAAIYAREISPQLDKGLRLQQVLASNSLGTLNGELVTQRSLTLLKRQYPALTAFSNDFSSENAAFGQTIKARIRSIPTVTPYNTTTGYATSSATTTDVDLVISGHQAVQISFNANELAQTGRDLFGEQAEGAHAAIAADLFDTAVGVITPANFVYETAVALNSFARSSLSGISKTLTERHVARMGRFALLNLDYYDKLGQDTTIVSLAAYQRPEVITEGELPRLAKLQPYEIEDFPTDDSLVGFAGAPDALVLATRVPSDYTKLMPDVASNGVVQYVRNPDLGMTVMLVRFIDHQAGTATWRLAYMRGAAKGNALAGQRIVSAATSS